ncbi:MAG: hypothetical protein CMQ40_04020 [Gammaproteobacteria bacterium]|nr:hypothetical protein [Gammaproteobacteria bacterium]
MAKFSDLLKRNLFTCFALGILSSIIFLSGCSSLYEYKPPALVSISDRNVEVAHRNKWRFGKNYNVTSETEILRKAQVACYVQDKSVAIYRKRYCDDVLNKKHCGHERFVFSCKISGPDTGNTNTGPDAFITYSRAKAI